MSKKQSKEGATADEQGAPIPAGMCEFRTNTPWSGHNFNLMPGETLLLPLEAGQIRQDAGLGEIVA